ncbi:MAG: outer membrane beta-barrel protein [Bacteroidia bacterium]
MKKLVYSLFIISLGFSSVKAQDDAGDKKVKLGIAFTPAVNWLKPDNANKVKSGGMAMKMGIGLVADFRLTNIIWFHTGIEYTTAGGKLNYTANDSAYYFYNNDAIVKVSPKDANDPASNANTTSTYKVNQLLSRNHKVGYVHIPLGFKLKTKEIGAITYFGQIGADVFFLTSAKGDDHVNQYTHTTIGYTTTDLKNNNIKGSVNFFNAAASVGFGGEYRISGSTALMVSLQYRHGIMNFTSKDNDYLLKYTQETSYAAQPWSQFQNATKLRQIVLTVGIMF